MQNNTDSGDPLYGRKDLSSFSNSSEVLPLSLHLDWDIDFVSSTISGFAVHELRVLTDGCEEVCFDSSNLNITGDVLIDDKEPTELVIADLHPVLGRKLSVRIPPLLRKEGTQFSVKISYFVDSRSSAVQWLPAAATQGKMYPYVFTQSQAIHARSLFPCMDSPGVKFPYTARVTCPKWCTALMSALSDSRLEDNSITSVSTSVAYYTQPVSTPAYLVALAAGNLASRDISSRVRIWAEPEVVDAAFMEFSETEEFLCAAEALTCPYQWTRYDVLCLPPSFPYGGMENPVLTFATPTLLAGDKSLADVIAHEIAHSWTGNLVTNHTWAHFWLNEGWTVWLERKITSRVKRNVEVGLLSSQIGWKHLRDDVARMGASDPFTQLVWPLTGQDPDDAFSSVPYEKGFYLLNYLEGIVGSDVFEAFAKAYIDKFKFGTTTTGDFRDLFIQFISTLPTKPDTATIKSSHASPDRSAILGAGKVATPKNSTAPSSKKDGATPVISASAHKLVQAIDWDKLFLSPGLPELVPDFSNSLSAVALSLAKKWIQYSESVVKVGTPSKTKIPDKPKTGAMNNWITNQKNVFLETILDHCEEKGAALPISVLDEIDAAYLFGVSKNSEIRFRWQTLCLRSDDTKIFPQVRNFVISQGRMKFVRPLYRALRNSASGKVLAVTTFEEFKDTYHPIARKMIASDLAKANETDPISSTEQLQAEVESIVSDRSGDTRRKSMRRKHSFTHRYESDIVSSEDSIHFEKHLNISEDAQQNVAKPNSDQTMRKPSSAASTKNNESGTSPLVFLAFGTSAAMMVLHYLSEKK